MLNIKPNGVYIDGTFGRGGHSKEIAKRLSGGKLICIDRDSTAIEYGKENFREFKNVEFIKGDFCDIPELVSETVDGILLDLGVSSPQLDEAERGFSYMADGPLDMRMDRSQSLSAADIVNKRSFEELRRVLSDYGEERYASKIASAIVREREKEEIVTTLRLVDIIKSAKVYPTIYPNWDVTPRIGYIGTILQNSTPTLFKQHVQQILNIISHKDDEDQVIFLKSWNEWGEGNYMEPDLKFGKGFIHALRDALNE